MKKIRITNDKQREFDDMRRYVFKRSESGAEECIDEMTWKDLVMDEVFKRIDYTSSTAGEYVFYDMLRRPRFERFALDERQSKIQRFEKDDDLKQQTVKVLRKAGKTDMDVANVLYCDMEYEKKMHWLCKGLYIALLAMIVLMLIYQSSVAMLFISIVLMINMALHYKLKLKMVGRVEAVQYLGRLVNDAIPNDIFVSQNSVLITGSNMSGKSTFVRMIGVNALLAQTIMTCICESYEASFFRIVTSISPQDDLMSGKSYYMSEAESIKRIIDSSGREITTLALIDEMFRGTNPIERVNAAAEILDYVDARNGLVMVATHDLELTKMVSNYDFYYFMDDVDDEGLAFDYTIRPGISPTRNAVKVLKLLGYPDELLDRIEKQLEAKTLAV